jgi:hypothetical protein
MRPRSSSSLLTAAYLGGQFSPTIAVSSGWHVTTTIRKFPSPTDSSPVYSDEDDLDDDDFSSSEIECDDLSPQPFEMDIDRPPSSKLEIDTNTFRICTPCTTVPCLPLPIPSRRCMPSTMPTPTRITIVGRPTPLLSQHLLSTLLTL